MSGAVAAELAQLAAQIASLASRLAGAATEDDYITLDEAAQIARVSVRTLRDAKRTGDLVVYGKQRSRTVRRGDLAKWIESRKVKPMAGADDLDIERRMRRISREAAQ